MKVLQVGLSNNPGGVETFALNYDRQLTKKGIRFDYVSMYGDIAYANEIRQLGGKIFLIPNIKKDYLGYIKEFQRILRQERYDVVHVNMLSAANIVPLRLAKKMGVKKVIAHSHNGNTTGIVRKWMHWLNRLRINNYANIKLACSKEAAEFLYGAKYCKNGEVTIIRNAIDTERYLFSLKDRRELRDKLGWEESLVVGHVGRFSVQKNHDAIIEIFREVLKRKPETVLCLVGDGELYQEIDQKLKKYGIYDKVYFAGMQSEVWKYLSAMDVFLMPSLFEGLPFALIEAQASGLPCVVSDVVSEEAVLTDRVSTLALDESFEKWAEKIISSFEQGRLNKQKTSGIIKKAHFDIKEEAERLFQLYQE